MYLFFLRIQLFSKSMSAYKPVALYLVLNTNFYFLGIALNFEKDIFWIFCS